MSRREPARSSLRRAYVVSTALHLVALPLLLALLNVPNLDQRTNFATQAAIGTSERVTIERRAVPRATFERAHSAAIALVPHDVPRADPSRPFNVTTHAKRPIASPHTTVVTGTPLAFTVKRAPHERVLVASVTNLQPATEHQTASATATSAAHPASGLGLVVATPSAAPATATAQPPAAPTATPAAELAHEAVAHDASAHGTEVVAVGGWGQSFEKPIVADESALADLKKRYRLAASVAVAVDESGHATHVSMPASLPADIRANLEKDLLALHYVPAECNGLRCTGTADVEL